MQEAYPNAPSGVQPDFRLSTSLGSPNLDKASVDVWEYLVGLRSGIIFRCTEIQRHAQWLRLQDAEPVGLEVPHFIWGRPVDVRLLEVAWVGDCDS